MKATIKCTIAALLILGLGNSVQAQETRLTAKSKLSQSFGPPTIKKNPVSLNERGTLKINGSDNDDLVVVKERDGDIVVYMFRAGVLSTDTFRATDVSNIWFYALGGDDRFHNDTSVGCNAFGGDGNDILKGGSGRDILEGDKGDDQMFGRGGFDQLFGSQGNDELDGGDDGVEDSLHGAGGNDVFHNYEVRERYIDEKGSTWWYMTTEDWIQDLNPADDVEVVH